MFLNQKVEGERVEIQIPLKPPFIVYVHPDGAANFLEADMRSRLDDVTRAEKRLAKVNRRLNSGILDADEYEEKKAQTDKDFADAKAQVQKALDNGEITQSQKDAQLKLIETTYKDTCSDLLNQRDGEPCTPDEDAALTAEKKQWELRTSLKPFAVPYLSNVLLGWEYWMDEEAKSRGEACLPVSETFLESMGELQIRLISLGVMNHFSKKVDEEKKSLPTGSDITTTSKLEAASLNGGLSIKSAESGNLTLMKSKDGEAEKSAAVQ